METALMIPDKGSLNTMCGRLNICREQFNKITKRAYPILICLPNHRIRTIVRNDRRHVLYRTYDVDSPCKDFPRNLNAYHMN